jgi:hypothetical protein
MVTINKAIVGGESDWDVWQGCGLDLSMDIDSRLPRYIIEMMRGVSGSTRDMVTRLIPNRK